jgi:hypothetical protein
MSAVGVSSTVTSSVTIKIKHTTSVKRLRTCFFITYFYFLDKDVVERTHCLISLVSYSHRNVDCPVRWLAVELHTVPGSLTEHHQLTWQRNKYLWPIECPSRRRKSSDLDRKNSEKPSVKVYASFSQTLLRIRLLPTRPGRWLYRDGKGMPHIRCSHLPHSVRRKLAANWLSQLEFFLRICGFGLVLPQTDNSWFH